jgi:uncharacterized protein YaeQ
VALKPTIYKIQVNLADSDRNCFEELPLTIAQHPSETLERLTSRLLAYCLNSGRGLEFTRGLSTADEPDIWQHSDSGEIEHWIEIGQPEEPRLRKACGKSRHVSIYAFGKSADTWWKINGPAISALPRLTVWHFPWQEVVDASGLIDRTAKWNISIVGGTLYLDNGSDSTVLEPQQLHAAD